MSQLELFPKIELPIRKDDWWHSIVEQSMEAIELMQADRDLYLGFWLAIGGCLRKSEIKQCRWEFLIEMDGKPRITGGIRKTGEPLDVPLQSKAYEALKRFRLESGFIIRERGDKWARRLSLWMRCQGWKSRKTLHELRAFTGSRLYAKASPVIAMHILGHRSIRTTENFYVHHKVKTDSIDVL